VTSRLFGPAEVARLTSVSTDTLRHYERKGLLARPHRTTAGYRRYPAEAVERVRLIQRAIRIGFSLQDLARVLAERDRGGAPCRAVRELVAGRLAHLDDEIAELSRLRDEVGALLGSWDTRLAATPQGARAHLLEDLHDPPAGAARARSRRLTRR